jgi:hypothetical protein
MCSSKCTPAGHAGAREPDHPPGKGPETASRGPPHLQIEWILPISLSVFLHAGHGGPPGRRPRRRCPWTRRPAPLAAAAAAAAAAACSRSRVMHFPPKIACGLVGASLGLQIRSHLIPTPVEFVTRPPARLAAGMTMQPVTPCVPRRSLTPANPDAPPPRKAFWKLATPPERALQGSSSLQQPAAGPSHSPGPAS